MSVGGTIIDIVQVSPNKWWVDTIDTHAVPTPGRHSSMAVYVDPAGHSLDVGDSLWWQGKKCYWTSRRLNAQKDVPLTKLSYSGVPHPDMEKVQKR